MCVSLCVLYVYNCVVVYKGVEKVCWGLSVIVCIKCCVSVCFVLLVVDIDMCLLTQRNVPGVFPQLIVRE